MKKLMLLLSFTLYLFAGNLTLQEGFVAAHTEVFGDSTIDPLNNVIHADLSMDADEITSIKGVLSVDMKLFVSDSSDRDEHMHKSTQALIFPLAFYTITSVNKNDEVGSYTLNGILDFHGVKKELSFNAEISLNNGTLSISAISSILVSEYGIDMPCLLGFALCVEDKVDIFAKAVLTK